MAQILELSYQPASATSSAMVHFSVDGREYVLVAGAAGYVTVATGRWIKDRRSFGKTFHRPAELAAHYKRDGAELLEQARRIQPAWAGAASR
jgi:hypothetical protein